MVFLLSVLKEYCILLNMFNVYQQHLLVENKKEYYLNYYFL
jgi:hypothetical protein